MTAAAHKSETLLSAIWSSSDEQGDREFRAVAIVLVGAALLTLSAKLQTPWAPVPATMQTFAVIVLGAVLGMRLAMASYATYLAQGLLGMPVFAAGGGAAYLLGPTGGYLVGMLLAAGLVGWAADRGFGRRPLFLALAMAAAMTLIYAFGFAWLSNLIGAERAWQAGVQPFILIDMVKIALAVAIIVGGHSAIAWLRR